MTNTTPEMLRHLAFEGTFNVRDVGGYTTKAGGETRWHTLFRADSLHRLSPTDQQTLGDLGLQTVIDLRYADEAAKAPNVYSASETVRYLNIPLLAVPTGDPAQAKLPDSLEEIYRSILDSSQAAIKQVFDVLTAEASGAVLVHCTAGKDRTGMIIALALSAVGVPDETVIEDYALTAQYIQHMLEGLRAQFPPGEQRTAYERMLDSKPEFMANTLAYLREKYGSAVEYLRGVGLDDAQIERLRAKLVG